MKHSLQEDIIRWLANNPDWHPKGEILNIIWKYPDGRTYMSDTVSRKLRNSEEERRIAVKPDPNSNSILYRFLPVERREKYINFSNRRKGDEHILFRI